jgi:hypothetical protein
VLEMRVKNEQHPAFILSVTLQNVGQFLQIGPENRKRFRIFPFEIATVIL